MVAGPWRSRSQRRRLAGSIQDGVCRFNAADPAALTRLLDLPDLAVTRLKARHAWGAVILERARPRLRGGLLPARKA